MAPQPPIYCDYNATAPLRPQARDAMIAALELDANPSSVHGPGRKARAAVEGAREQVAAAIGACREDIVFASGGTEANAAPLRGARDADPSLQLWASAIEHDAVAATGVVRVLPVDASGRLDLNALDDALADIPEGVTPLLSVMLANNETGVIQPVAEAAERVHAAGGLIHCDAVQGLGKIPVSVVDLDVDYLSLSAHKLGGPQGVGAFYLKPGTIFQARLRGGGQEMGRRSGTENVAGIIGFGMAAEISSDGLEAMAAVGAHRDALEAELRKIAPSVAIYGADAPRLPNTSCFGVAGVAAETLVMALDLAGVAVSAGSACSSGKVKPSRVLTAMGFDEDAAKSAIRASFGWASEPSDYSGLAAAWRAAISRMRPDLTSKKEPEHVGH